MSSKQAQDYLLSNVNLWLATESAGFALGAGILIFPVHGNVCEAGSAFLSGSLPAVSDLSNVYLWLCATESPALRCKNVDYSKLFCGRKISALPGICRLSLVTTARKGGAILMVVDVSRASERARRLQEWRYVGRTLLDIDLRYLFLLSSRHLDFAYSDDGEEECPVLTKMHFQKTTVRSSRYLRSRANHVEIPCQY